MVDREARLLLLAAGGAGLLLVAVAPDPASAVAQLTRPGTDPFAPAVAAAALVSWGCVGYLVLAVSVTAGARLPGRTGRALARLARAVVPAGLRRLLGLALGVSLVSTGVVGPWAVPAAAGTAAAAVAGGTDLAQLSLDWPGVSRTSAVRVAAQQDVPSPAPAAVPGATDGTLPARPVAVQPQPPDDAGRPPTGRQPQLRTPAVTVQPGDTLWSLARSRLGPDAPARQVAQLWPAWWQANRAVIGEDPDLLLPGTRLVPPRT